MGVRWLTVPQAAEELSVSEQTVREWTRRKNDPLPCHLPPGNKKRVRIYFDELDAWLLENDEINIRDG